MRRRLFTALSVLSLVLCAATAMLWVRSYVASDMLNWGSIHLLHTGNPLGPCRLYVGR